MLAIAKRKLWCCKIQWRTGKHGVSNFLYFRHAYDIIQRQNYYLHLFFFLRKIVSFQEDDSIVWIKNPEPRPVLLSRSEKNCAKWNYPSRLYIDRSSRIVFLHILLWQIRKSPDASHTGTIATIWEAFRKRAARSDELYASLSRITSRQPGFNFHSLGSGTHE